MNGNTNEDAQFHLSSHSWDAVKDGFSLCFPQYTVTTNIEVLYLGERDILAEGSDEAVRGHIEKCSVNGVPAVFVYELRLGDTTVPVGHVEPTHILRRPQHHVAIAIFESVRDQLAKDGQSIDEYTSVEFKILVPKYISLKQQTKERIEACAELVRDGEDSSCLVEKYPFSSASSVERMKNFELKILDKSNSKVLYVLIVDECHYSPTQNAIPLLHNSELHDRLNFVVLMVSATPYNCLSDQSRVPANNIIEWGQKMDRPNYIGFEHYFRSATYRLPFLEMSLKIEGVPLVISLPRHREFAGFSILATVITTQLENCSILFGSVLRCVYVSSRFKLCFKRRGKALTVWIECNPLLRSLGFDKDVTFATKGIAECEATNAPTVDDGTSVASEHMRDDSHFSVLHSSILAACPKLTSYNTKITRSVLNFVAYSKHLFVLTI